MHLRYTTLPWQCPKSYIPRKFSFKKGKGNFPFLRYTLDSKRIMSYLTQIIKLWGKKWVFLRRITFIFYFNYLWLYLKSSIIDIIDKMSKSLPEYYIFQSSYSYMLYHKCKQGPKLPTLLSQYLMHLSLALHHWLSTTLIQNPSYQLRVASMSIRSFAMSGYIHMPEARFQPQVMTKWWVVESLSRHLQT